MSEYSHISYRFKLSNNIFVVLQKLVHFCLMSENTGLLDANTLIYGATAVMV